MIMRTAIGVAGLLALFVCHGIRAEEGPKPPPEPKDWQLSKHEIKFERRNLGEVSPANGITLTAGPNSQIKAFRIKVSGEYIANAQGCDPLDASKACTVNVSFAPKQRGSAAGEILVTSDGGNVRDTVRLMAKAPAERATAASQASTLSRPSSCSPSSRFAGT